MLMAIALLFGFVLLTVGGAHPHEYDQKIILVPAEALWRGLNAQLLDEGPTGANISNNTSTAISGGAETPNENNDDNDETPNENNDSNDETPDESEETPNKSDGEASDNDNFSSSFEFPSSHDCSEFSASSSPNNVQAPIKQPPQAKPVSSFLKPFTGPSDGHGAEYVPAHNPEQATTPPLPGGQVYVHGSLCKPPLRQQPNPRATPPLAGQVEDVNNNGLHHNVPEPFQHAPAGSDSESHTDSLPSRRRELSSSSDDDNVRNIGNHGTSPWSTSPSGKHRCMTPFVAMIQANSDKE